MKLYKLFKSVLDRDTAPVVVCDMDDIIVYMNPSAIERYHKNLTGRSIKDCHPTKANEMIEKVVNRFKESKENNINIQPHYPHTVVYPRFYQIKNAPTF